MLAQKKSRRIGGTVRYRLPTLPVMRPQTATMEFETGTTWDSNWIVQRSLYKGEFNSMTCLFPANSTRIHVSFETQPICKIENTLNTNHWICIINVFSRFEMVACSRERHKKHRNYNWNTPKLNSVWGELDKIVTNVTATQCHWNSSLIVLFGRTNPTTWVLTASSKWVILHYVS